MSDDVVEFVQAVTPPFVAGMLALITALVLFGFQQRATRKARRREQLDGAFEHVMDMFRVVQDGVADPSRKQIADDLADAMLRFAWLLGRRDAPIASWVAIKGNEVVIRLRRTADVEARAVLAGTIKSEVAVTLRMWRDRYRRRGWFVTETARIAAELRLTPDDLKAKGSM